jgi:hypothetical protein
VLTETPGFGTVTVPDPGDNRTAASVDGALQELANRTRYTYNGARTGQWDAMRTYSGLTAAGDVSTDDTAALAAGIAACAAGGGGDFCISKPHRITDELSIPSSVNLIGMNHSAGLFIDHGTRKTIKLISGTYPLSASRIEGLIFGALQNNSGSMIYNDAGTAARVIVKDCFFGFDSHSQGRAVQTLGNTHVELLNNFYNVFGGDYIACSGSFTELIIRGGTFLLPASAYASVLIDTLNANARVSVSDVFFNGEAVTAGGGPIVFSPTSGYLVYSGNHFKGSVAANMTVLAAGVGAQVVEGPNTYAPTVTQYAPGTTIADGSSLSPYVKWFRASGIGATYTWPDHVETLELEGAGATPTITLPTAAYAGMRRRLVIRNASGGAWGSIIFSPSAPLLTGIPGVALANGQSAAFDLQVLRVAAGSPGWTVTHQGP